MGDELEGYVRSLETERRRPVPPRPVSSPRDQLSPDPMGPARLAEATREILQYEMRKRAEAEDIETT